MSILVANRKTKNEAELLVKRLNKELKLARLEITEISPNAGCQIHAYGCAVSPGHTLVTMSDLWLEEIMEHSRERMEHTITKSNLRNTIEHIEEHGYDEHSLRALKGILDE